MTHPSPGDPHCGGSGPALGPLHRYAPPQSPPISYITLLLLHPESQSAMNKYEVMMTKI